MGVREGQGAKGVAGKRFTEGVGGGPGVSGGGREGGREGL